MALRLARAYSGGSSNTIVVDGAYHGHTLATLEVSPYKYEHGTECTLIASSSSSGSSAPSPGKHIWKVPSPDTYRGEHRDWSTAGAKYAAYVQDACQTYRDAGEKVRAFIIEGGMSVAGVILPPPGYLSACVKAVHAAGGLYISDEVQTGLGRFGSCFWAFQHCHSPDEPEVIPDIVTIGKPFGNGMPLAAVVTSKKVAAAFEDCGVEYFNTFGGNPVCASAGLAVLNIIKEEGLQEKALEVGTYLKTKFRKLQERIQLIGDIRGTGLFLGIEFVRNRQTLEPATAETSFVCSVLKSKYHILTSIDGPNDNVLVVKPPMVFSKADADYFCQCLDDALTIDLSAAGDIMTNISKTPT
jgi:4-aminobutyrate aminotransferase-like enzyme